MAELMAKIERLYERQLRAEQQARAVKNEKVRVYPTEYNHDTHACMAGVGRLGGTVIRRHYHDYCKL
jgi:hypothetical protein